MGFFMCIYFAATLKAFALGFALRIYIGFLKRIDGFCPLFLQKDMLFYIYEIVHKPFGFYIYTLLDISPLKKSRK